MYREELDFTGLFDLDAVVLLARESFEYGARELVAILGVEAGIFTVRELLEWWLFEPVATLFGSTLLWDELSGTGAGVVAGAERVRPPMGFLSLGLCMVHGSRQYSFINLVA